MKKILFLSALDFKEKSIQVIKKTPEAYALNGWFVRCIVARDNCSSGDYFYEREINIPGVSVLRFYWPLNFLRAFGGRYLRLIFSKIASLIVIFRLFFYGLREIKHNNYDVIYGYEQHGVLAVALLKPFLRKEKIITRFQGSFVNEMLEKKQILRLLFNIDLLCALRVRSHLTIMTNDGTCGDLAINKLRAGRDGYGPVLFLVNGVDLIEDIPWPSDGSTIKMISISRLVHWKRVDRSIKIIHQLVSMGFNNFKFEIIGEGEKKEELIRQVQELGLDSFVSFLGGIDHKDVLERLKSAQIFISMYESSNVGNPLLEAMRANKIIFTLNNGDTARWIVHRYNGFIYEEGDDFYKSAAKDIIDVCSTDFKFVVKKNLALDASSKLMNWNDRFCVEIDEVSKVCDL